MMTKIEIELIDRLLAVWNDTEFVLGCLAYLENDSERRKMIEYITENKSATAEELVLFALEVDSERQGA